MKLIDKSALVAEIKRRKELVSDPILSGNDLMIGERNAYFNLLSFIDTMQEEPVSEELEEAAEDYCKSTLVGSHYIKKNAFKAGAKWQKQKTIDKSCEYLDLHCDEVKTEDNGIAGWIDNEFINNFKQAMKDE